jgi:zinc transport system substrate-binding protein
MLSSFRLLVLALMAVPAHAETPDVVVDIAPVHALVSQVMDGVGKPDLILQPGVSPHSYALRTSQARALRNAELVVWIGPELTPWLEKPVLSLATNAQTLALLSSEGSLVLPFRDGDEEEDEDHNEGHGEDHDEGVDEDHTEGHEHDHEGNDPHAWLDPQNAQVWLALIAEKLAKIDPENTDLYRANAIKGQAMLKELMAELDSTLTPVRSVPFVSYHDAFQYFENRFELNNAGFVSLSDGAGASPSRVSTLQDRMVALDVQCAFSEPGVDPGILQGLGSTHELTLSILDPIGRDLPLGSGFYPALLRNMAQNFVDCTKGIQ